MKRTHLARTARAWALVSGLVLAACATPPERPRFDVLIVNGRIVDGTGNGWFRADVGVRDGRIAAVGRLDRQGALRVIDAAQRIVAPGFIDTHVHIEQNLFETPTAPNFLHDGVTTVVTGNCGGSAPDIAAFLALVDTTRTSINVATLVGHNTVRRTVMGFANRAASGAEQTRMEDLVDAGLRDGAVGLSSGLIYLPGMYSTTDEVIGLARIAARHRGVYASHIRDEAGKVSEAIEEALRIGREADVPVQISHFKVSAPANWGRSRETLAQVESARAAGLDVTIDQYPYTASSTVLSVMLPDWAAEGGLADIRRRLEDPATRARIADEIVRNAQRNQRPSFAYAVVARHAADPTLNGRNLSEINLAKGRRGRLDDEVQTLLDLIHAGGAQMVFHGMAEDDVRHFMTYPFNMVGSDGGVQSGTGLPHPRSYGTHARVLGTYVREQRMVRLEEAVRRMTSLAAQRFGLKDRGVLREGYAADVVVFDEQTVRDRATFESPHQFSQGIETVLVNGVVTVAQGRHTGERAGRALRGPAFVERR